MLDLKNEHLVIVAHPDDETIFFGGTIMMNPKLNWKIIVVSDGNARGRSSQRRLQFTEACRALGVQRFEHWNFPDLPGIRLDQAHLLDRFKRIETCGTVLTHGILGEYGHPHHQDVSIAVHRAFCKRSRVWSLAYNSFPSRQILLPKEIFERKAQILSTVYRSEISRFANVLPVAPIEGFHEIGPEEAEHIYAYLSNEISEIQESKLIVYKHFLSYFALQKECGSRSIQKKSKTSREADEPELPQDNYLEGHLPGTYLG